MVIGKKKRMGRSLPDRITTGKLSLPVIITSAPRQDSGAGVGQRVIEIQHSPGQHDNVVNVEPAGHQRGPVSDSCASTAAAD